MALRGKIQSTSDVWVVTTPPVVQLVAGMRLNLSFMNDVTCLHQVRSQDVEQYTRILHPTLPAKEVGGWELALRFTEGTSLESRTKASYISWLVDNAGAFRAMDLCAQVNRENVCFSWAELLQQ
jgi:hypothetical protein